MNLTTNLTTINYSSGRSRNNIKYLVFHYTANNGDTAAGNANYFKSTYRSASAHYFVDKNNVVQVVNDSDTAWHCGDNQKYTNGGASMKNIVTNYNSIGIEMCSDKVNGQYVITESTQANAIELGKILMNKYGIPISNVFRHYDITGKICPEPFVADESQWINFKERLKEDEMTQDKFNEMMNNYLDELASQQPSSWSKEQRIWAENNGLITGDENGWKHYRSFVTREQAAILFKRLYDLIK
ncbi:peptidoglycan recognition protein family protein [Anaerovorax odorimutans]|uniref:peptidoglycan recognition protein family protein n=1 Tax=Anaerovorax odorimutans TaxID=109327 RepID=UPI00042798B7|nr:N-acetylmuramoyl-L-alanine amidase [Anaerovorax odorimutans]